MSKDSPTKCYQNTKKYYKTNCKRYQSLSKEQKEKSDNMVMNDTKAYQKMRNKSLLSIEKIMIKRKKTPYYNYKKLFPFRKSTIILKSNDKSINLP